MKFDCFAYNCSNGRCNALTVIDCDNCKFYRTAEDARCDRRKAFESLQKKDTFIYFKDKYSLKSIK